MGRGVDRVHAVEPEQAERRVWEGALEVLEVEARATIVR